MAIDRRSGYHTHNMLCVPLRNREGAAIGVTQVLNKRHGDFNDADLDLTIVYVPGVSSKRNLSLVSTHADFHNSSW